ncbi:MAG: TonB family protein [Fimbriimonas ginsengisoli]|uniref:TonB family protein n=1 Tax=Fimbriimonas ginsengisoli TaxID=1005039 RepID=A0A931LYN2_FIMGI|nr:TonB family protein [Fimbriimonas ginsengisoli]MBI3721421.1 TonB family protein [Fimbriimonas ginsengisoli]
MSRRRRRKSPLLGRILLISVAAHVVALPILAHYGALEKIRSTLAEATVSLVQGPEEEHRAEKQEEKKPKKSERKGAGVGHRTPLPPNPSAPKIVTAGAAGDDSGDTPAVESGTGRAGVLPAASPPPATPHETPVERTVLKPAAPPETVPAPAPKHEPIIVDAEPLDQPQPTIPDDLRAEAMERTFVAEFVVGPDGLPKQVSVVRSTGVAELDEAALRAARRWRFRPATSDGAPTDGRIRLRIEFKVE